MRRPRPVLLVGLAAAGTALATAVPALATTAAIPLRQVLTGVAGAAPVRLAGARDLGGAPVRTEHATLALALRDRRGMDALIARGATVTPAQLAATYLPSPSTVAAATAWARSAGLRVDRTSGTLVSVSGSTSALDRAVGTRTDTFRAADGTTYRSIASTASLPTALAGSVVGITGLSDLGRATTAVRPRATFPRTFGPKELSAFYDAPAAATGAGQTVGVIAEGDLTGVLTDLRTFESTFGVPQASVSVTGPGSADVAGADEYDLDTQYATSQAPGAALRVYDGASLSNDDILSTINSWATEGTVQTASFSAGECELLAGATGFTTSLDQVLAQAAAQGQSLFVSSGDNGSFCTAAVGINGIPAGVPGVEYPASSPYAVGVGGTTVLGTPSLGSAYTGEVAWYAGGGGLSAFETTPPWQTSPVPVLRGVPDVALDADPTTGYSVVVGGRVETIGGTSASAPAWNGYWTRALGARGALGFAGPRLYGSGARGGFHDVVAGANGLYPATPGYDYTTGLGTPDVARLIPLL